MSISPIHAGAAASQVASGALQARRSEEAAETPSQEAAERAVEGGKGAKVNALA